MIQLSSTPAAPPSGGEGAAPPDGAARDVFDRPLRTLRLSVTDRCNLRCGYCMPEEDYAWLPREAILSFEELARLAEAFADAGVRKVRITGGEPLLRRDLHVLVRMLAADPRLADLALTTNGVRLAGQAARLREAGLRRVTVSLDTLHAERFRAFTRRDEHARVLEGIEAAGRAFAGGLKLNAVVIRGFNDDEVPDLVEFGRSRGAEVRFIEYMDVGGATRWRAADVVPQPEILAAVARRYGPVRPLAGRGSAPAERFALSDGTAFGVIASTTRPFCGACDRARLTTDGLAFLCLYGERGLDLRGRLRGGATRAELAAAVAEAWRGRDDRGAERRKALGHRGARGALLGIEELRRAPHREMHALGG